MTQTGHPSGRGSVSANAFVSLAKLTHVPFEACPVWLANSEG